jgi:hypothetical protein
VIFRDCRRIGLAPAGAFRIAARHHVVGHTFRVASVFPTSATVTTFAALFTDWIAHGNTH